MISSDAPGFNDFLRMALADERWFTDASPRWKHLPSSAAIEAEREKRARLFRRGGYAEGASILKACEPRKRCGSGACPACGRAIQRFLVSSLYSELKPHRQFRVVSLIPAQSLPKGRLGDLDLGDYKRSLMSTLQACRIKVFVGGIDFSLNEHTSDLFQAHWSPHVWLLTSSFNQPRWEKRLRRTFKRTRTVFRPVKIQHWDGNRAAIGYAFKTQFNRRISKIGERRYRDGSRMCRITSYDRLRREERIELYTFLHNSHLSDRILLKGMDDS